MQLWSTNSLLYCSKDKKTSRTPTHFLNQFLYLQTLMNFVTFIYVCLYTCCLKKAVQAVNATICTHTKQNDKFRKNFQVSIKQISARIPWVVLRWSTRYCSANPNDFRQECLCVTLAQPQNTIGLTTCHASLLLAQYIHQQICTYLATNKSLYNPSRCMKLIY
jgi:hypothetical protein